MKDFK